MRRNLRRSRRVFRDALGATRPRKKLVNNERPEGKSALYGRRKGGRREERQRLLFAGDERLAAMLGW